MPPAIDVNEPISINAIAVVFQVDFLSIRPFVREVFNPRFFKRLRFLRTIDSKTNGDIAAVKVLPDRIVVFEVIRDGFDEKLDKISF